MSGASPRGVLGLLLGVTLLASCSRSPSTETPSAPAPDTKPLMSQADAEKLIAQRFPVSRYVVNDFIPQPGAPPPQPINPPRTLNIGLYWVMNDELTPWYIAEEKGYFSQLGLNVKMTEGGPGRDMMSSLLANRIDLYVGPVENALYVINSRTGADLRIFCGLMKETPGGLIGLDNSIPHNQVSTRHIGRDDLVGRRIAMTPGGDYLIEMMCSELNIAPGDIHVLTAGATPDALLSGAADYYAGFLTNQPRILERNGYKNWTFFPYTEIGLHEYFDVSTVTGDFYRQNPQVLTNYVYALDEAIRWEMTHMDEAADIAVRYSPEYPITKAEALWRIKQELPIYAGDGSEPLLAMKASVVQKELAILYRYRQIELPDATASQ